MPGGKIGKKVNAVQALLLAIVLVVAALLAFSASVARAQGGARADVNRDVQPYQQGGNRHAQAYKNGTFYGVEGIIETADPKIREPGAGGCAPFSYASINIINTNSGIKWIETGWTKSPASGCVPKFTWAIQPGVANFINDVQPTVGVAYKYRIVKVSDGQWRLRIFTTGGLLLKTVDISNPGLNSGTMLQAVGEVHSPNSQQDMGVSGITSLKWRKSDGTWRPWNGWTKGVEDNPPYHVVAVPSDPNNAVQVYGNNGNPVPPGAPCP